MSIRKELLKKETFDCIKRSIKKNKVKLEPCSFVWKPKKPSKYLIKALRNRIKKKKRKSKKPKVGNYKTYIKSGLWKKIRKSYYKRHKKECKACKATYKICLHHKNYKRLGHEKDSDLIPLCWTCHGSLHDKYGHGAKNTDIFLSDKLKERLDDEFTEACKNF